MPSVVVGYETVAGAGLGTPQRDTCPGGRSVAEPRGWGSTSVYPPPGLPSPDLGTALLSEHCRTYPMPVSPFFADEKDPDLKVAAQQELSDMAYLRSKAVRAESPSSSSSSSSSSEDEESEDEAVHCDSEGVIQEEEERGARVTSTQQRQESTGAPTRNRKSREDGAQVCVWIGMCRSWRSTGEAHLHIYPIFTDPHFLQIG